MAPLNVDEPGDFWDKIGKQWDTSTKAARCLYVQTVSHLIFHLE